MYRGNHIQYTQVDQSTNSVQLLAKNQNPAMMNLQEGQKDKEELLLKGNEKETVEDKTQGSQQEGEPLIFELPSRKGIYFSVRWPVRPPSRRDSVGSIIWVHSCMIHIICLPVEDGKEPFGRLGRRGICCKALFPIVMLSCWNRV